MSSRRVVWETAALKQAERFSASDPEGVKQVFKSADLLARDPKPSGSSGGNSTRRIHVGAYRLMYTIANGPPVVISIEHLGRA